MAILPIEHIERDPNILGGKPHVAGHRISVQNVAVLYQLHQWPVNQIADELELTPGQIYAALSYYHDHREEIDQAIRDADVVAEEMGTSLRSILERKNAK